MSKKLHNVKQMTSLDEKHQEMLNKFHNNEYKTVPKLKNEIVCKC